MKIIVKLITACLIAATLSSCGTMPPSEKIKLPEAPASLMVQCPETLAQLNDKTLVTKADLLDNVKTNSQTYYLCRNQVDGWQKFYKELRDEINK